MKKLFTKCSVYAKHRWHMDYGWEGVWEVLPSGASLLALLKKTEAKWHLLFPDIHPTPPTLWTIPLNGEKLLNKTNKVSQAMYDVLSITSLPLLFPMFLFLRIFLLIYFFALIWLCNSSAQIPTMAFHCLPSKYKFLGQAFKIFSQSASTLYF